MPASASPGWGRWSCSAGTGITQDQATGITVAGLAATAAAGSIDLGGANQIGAIAGSLADATTGLSATGGITLVNAAALAVDARVLAGNGQTIALTATDLTTSAGIATSGSSAGNRIDLRADTLVLGAAVTATGGVINILPGYQRPRHADRRGGWRHRRYPHPADLAVPVPPGRQRPAAARRHGHHDHGRHHHPGRGGAAACLASAAARWSRGSAATLDLRGAEMQSNVLAAFGG